MVRINLQFNTVDRNIETLCKMKEYTDAGMETALDIAEDVIQLEKDEGSQLKDLKDVMVEYCEMERDLKQFLEAVNHVKATLSASSEARELPDPDKLLDEKLKELSAKNSRNLLTKHDKYVNLIEKINSANESSQEQEEEKEEEMDEESEIAVTQQEVITICPYTRMEMQHPVKNKNCGHSYDRDGITQLIKHRGRRAKCPVSGCTYTGVLTKDDLTENKELKKIIDKKNRASGKRGSKK